MQLYNRGIRRRIAPMLANHRQRMELAHSLILTLPGTPVLRYGDELGMGEDLSLNERDSIRTPMQWANAKNGGFSSASPERVILPAISGGEFGYEKVNVAGQQRDPNSFLSWMERMTRLRMRSPEFGGSRFKWLDTNDPSVLAHACSNEGGWVFAVHNLSGREVRVDVALGHNAYGLFDLLQNCEHPAPQDGHQEFHLPAYGYVWLRQRHEPET